MSGNTTAEILALINGHAPQWSPLGMSGNTGHGTRDDGVCLLAAMKPARDEREYRLIPGRRAAAVHAAMEPARDEREYPSPTALSYNRRSSRNGARSG